MDNSYIARSRLSRSTCSLSLSTKVPLPEQGRPSIAIKGGGTLFETRVTTSWTETLSTISHRLATAASTFLHSLEGGRHRVFPITDIGHSLLVVRAIGKTDGLKPARFVEPSRTFIRLKAPEFECVDTGGLCCID